MWNYTYLIFFFNCGTVYTRKKQCRVSVNWWAINTLSLKVFFGQRSSYCINLQRFLLEFSITMHGPTPPNYTILITILLHNRTYTEQILFIRPYTIVNAYIFTSQRFNNWHIYIIPEIIICLVQHTIICPGIRGQLRRQYEA